MKFSVPSAKSPPNANPPLQRPGSPHDVDCVVTGEARCSEVALTVRPLPGEELAKMFSRLAVALKELDATIVHLTVFGAVHANAAGIEAMRRVFGAVNWPLTWVEGGACAGGPIAGVQASALAGGAVERIRLNGQVVGSVFEDGVARHCRLGGIGPGSHSLSREGQVRSTLDVLELALGLAGCSLADVMRTWFFLDDILMWYSQFNQVRTQVYSGTRFRAGSLPASTGVAGRNPTGTALVAGAWAMQPLAATRLQEVASPLQCPASTYGSSFSRALEISSGAGRQLLISGTASIAPNGRTLWPGDLKQQIALTLDVVEALLDSRGFAWPDISRATAYFKNGGDLEPFANECAARGWQSLPVVAVQSDICRRELLFELEADAWTANAAGR